MPALLPAEKPEILHERQQMHTRKLRHDGGAAVGGGIVDDDHFGWQLRRMLGQ